MILKTLNKILTANLLNIRPLGLLWGISSFLNKLYKYSFNTGSAIYSSL